MASKPMHAAPDTDFELEVDAQTDNWTHAVTVVIHHGKPGRRKAARDESNASRFENMGPKMTWYIEHVQDADQEITGVSRTDAGLGMTA